MKKADIHNTALAAGGAGFIGSHLCDRLIMANLQINIFLLNIC